MRRDILVVALDPSDLLVVARAAGDDDLARATGWLESAGNVRVLVAGESTARSVVVAGVVEICFGSVVLNATEAFVWSLATPGAAPRGWARAYEEMEKIMHEQGERGIERWELEVEIAFAAGHRFATRLGFRLEGVKFHGDHTGAPMALYGRVPHGAHEKATAGVRAALNVLEKTIRIQATLAESDARLGKRAA